MANFNTGKIYNKIMTDGGANYNSAPFFIIVSDSSLGTDSILSIINTTIISETATAEEIINTSSSVNISDNSNVSSDTINVINNINVADTGNGIDLIDSILNNLNIAENGYGIDFISMATTYFFISADNILNPLGVLVTRDTREEILPTIKNYTEAVPGKHGEYKFKTELKGKTLELTVVTDEGLTPKEKEDLKRLFAKYLSPLSGEKSLTFADDIERQYKVRYSGKISPDEYASWFKFVIPFKMSSPFITGSFENIQIGNGTIENEGNIDTHIIIEISGLTNNPSLIVNGETLTFTGTINAGEVLKIDTLKKTAKIGDVNVLDNWCKIFPVLNPNTTINVEMENNIAIKWRNRWI